MTVDGSLQKLLDRLPAPDRLDFASLQAALDTTRYTGALTIHFMNGRPRQVDLGAPVRLSIVQGGVDSGSSSRSS